MSEPLLKMMLIEELQKLDGTTLCEILESARIGLWEVPDYIGNKMDLSEARIDELKKIINEIMR